MGQGDGSPQFGARHCTPLSPSDGWRSGGSAVGVIDLLRKTSSGCCMYQSSETRWGGGAPMFRFGDQNLLDSRALAPPDQEVLGTSRRGATRLNDDRPEAD
jgi:hypothetical protein